jgi:hypothetical protein
MAQNFTQSFNENDAYENNLLDIEEFRQMRSSKNPIKTLGNTIPIKVDELPNTDDYEIKIGFKPEV